MPEVGTPAPLFTGVTQTGEPIRLVDYRGRKVALYFYPKDDTPGCTKQACSLRDGWSALAGAGIEVIGVSADQAGTHARFAEKYALPFPLVADPDHEVLNLYGTWGERNRYGIRSMGILRTTFLIDEEGRIRKVIRRPDVNDHAEEVLRGFGIDSVDPNEPSR